MSQAVSMEAQPRSDRFFSEGIAAGDPALFAAMREELARQSHEIELIASENIVSRAVLEARRVPVTCHG